MPMKSALTSPDGVLFENSSTVGNLDLKYGTLTSPVFVLSENPSTVRHLLLKYDTSKSQQFRFEKTPPLRDTSCFKQCVVLHFQIPHFSKFRTFVKALLIKLCLNFKSYLNILLIVYSFFVESRHMQHYWPIAVNGGRNGAQNGTSYWKLS